MGSGGIGITPTAGAAIANQPSVAVTTGGSGASSASGTTGPWRPPQWAAQGQNGTYMMTVTSGTTDTAAGASTTGATQNYTTKYVFDAVLRAAHTVRLQITEHPIQTGANISDHAYMLPAYVTLEIGMSDAMDVFAPNMWVGSASVSVSAYQTLMNLQSSRSFITLTTRLNTYQNMMIESIAPEETSATVASLRATVTFKQVFTATVATQSLGARPNTTDDTSLATTQTTPVPAAVTNQYAVPAAPAPTVAALPPPSTPNAGSWSSAVTSAYTSGSSF